MHSGLDFGATDAPVADTAPFDHDTPLGEPTDAPPPYHSVVLQSTNSVEPPSTSGRQPGSGMYGVPANSDFCIRVTDPVRQGEGVAAYVSYKVITRTSAPGYRQQAEVIRRFKDFVWLQHRLRHELRGVVVPPLPERNVLEKYKMTTEFIEQRRAALTVFINRVAAHPALRGSHELQLFLEASETEFAIEVSRSQVVDPAVGQGAAKKTLTGAVTFLRELSHTASNLYHKRTDDEEEDAEYLRASGWQGGWLAGCWARLGRLGCLSIVILTLPCRPNLCPTSMPLLKVRAYYHELERHLAEAHRQASRLVRHQQEMGESVREFGVSMAALGRYEESGLIADSFGQLADRADTVAQLCSKTSASLASCFEAPLKEFVRGVRAVKKVCEDRSAALAAYQQARGDVDVRRQRLAKLRGTPGIREERVSEAERDLSDAQQRAEAAKATYETIVQRMSGELDRFQRERAAEMNYVMRDFAVAQARVSDDTARLWGSLVTASAG